MELKYWFSLLLLVSCCCQGDSYSLNFFAREFEREEPIVGGEIYSVSGDDEKLVATTDEYGRATVIVESPEPLTFYIEETHGFLGRPRIYSGLIDPGAKDYKGEFGEITFQVPYKFMISYLQSVLSLHFSSDAKPEHCHVVTTVTPDNKSLKDCPHGLEGVQLELEPKKYEARYYFDVLRKIPFFYLKTDLFINLGFFSVLSKGCELACHSTPFFFSLNCTVGANDIIHYLGLDKIDRVLTSVDGGVMFLNVPVREEPYTIRSFKSGYSFEPVRFVCRDRAFINISPPQGPVGRKMPGNNESSEWSEYTCPVN